MPRPQCDLPCWLCKHGVELNAARSNEALGGSRMTKKASAIRQYLVLTAILLSLSVMATPMAAARTPDALSAASKSQHLRGTPSKRSKHMINLLLQRPSLASKFSPVSYNTWQSPEPLARLTAVESMVLPGFAQLGVCESPLRSRFFHDDVHVGLRCDDQVFDQPTALDGFARMRYHISVPQ